MQLTSFVALGLALGLATCALTASIPEPANPTAATEPNNKLIYTDYLPEEVLLSRIHGDAQDFFDEADIAAARATFPELNASATTFGENTTAPAASAMASPLSRRNNRYDCPRVSIEPACEHLSSAGATCTGMWMRRIWCASHKAECLFIHPWLHDALFTCQGACVDRSGQVVTGCADNDNW